MNVVEHDHLDTLEALKELAQQLVEASELRAEAHDYDAQCVKPVRDLIGDPGGFPLPF